MFLFLIYVALHDYLDVSTTQMQLISVVPLELHTHPFNGPLSGTTRVSRYQKDKTNLDITEAKRR